MKIAKHKAHEARPITAKEAEKAFFENSESAQNARKQMLERMGISKEDRSASCAHEQMIKRQKNHK